MAWRMSGDSGRRKKFEKLAGERGWTYSPEKNVEVARFFTFLDQLEVNRSIDNRHAVDVMHGSWRGRTMMAFSVFTRETKRHTSDDDSLWQMVKPGDSHWHSVAAFQLPVERPLPELVVAPSSRFGRLVGRTLRLMTQRVDRLPKWFANPVPLDRDPAFAKAYRVLCSEHDLAEAICNEEMVRHLLANPNTFFEIQGQWLATVDDGRLDPNHVDRRLDQLEHVAQRLPPVLTGYGSTR